MDFDFALLLVVLTAVTGVIWLLDHLFFARGRATRSKALSAAEGSAVERQQRAQEGATVQTQYSPGDEPLIV